MIVEQRIYTIQAGKVAPFIQYFAAHGLAIQLRILGNLVGYFHSEIGVLNQVTQMWGYQSFEDRAERRAILAKDPQWLDYLKNQPPFILAQENRILIPASFSPIK